jgi:hypothetical protein
MPAARRPSARCSPNQRTLIGTLHTDQVSQSQALQRQDKGKGKAIDTSTTPTTKRLGGQDRGLFITMQVAHKQGRKEQRAFNRKQSHHIHPLHKRCARCNSASRGQSSTQPHENTEFFPRYEERNVNLTYLERSPDRRPLNANDSDFGFVIERGHLESPISRPRNPSQDQSLPQTQSQESLQAESDNLSAESLL